MNDDKIYVSLDKAISILPDGDQVHTFRNGGFALLGADWDKSELIDAMGEAEFIEIGGEACKAMNHALVFFDGTGAVFVEAADGTDWEALEASIREK